MDGRKKATQSPFYFIENIGQIKDQHRKDREDIDFRISSGGVNVFIGNGKLHYQWSKLETTEGKVPDMNRYRALEEKIRELEMRPGKEEALQTLEAEAAALDPLQLVTYRMDVTLVNANPNARLIKENQQQFFERYYHWSVKEEGAKAHAYKKVIYKDVYPNIDWVIYIKGQHVEHDFVIHPGGKVSDIKIRYDGATDLALNNDGSLTASTPFGRVMEAAPYSYQQDGKAVSSRYILKDNMLAFETGNYTGRLTIDPTLMWGTNMGAAPWTNTWNNTLDVEENTYVCGQIISTQNVSTLGAHQDTFFLSPISGQDAFLAKFNSNGDDLLWFTYYGGVAHDEAFNVQGDVWGNVYLTGRTSSLTHMASIGSFQDTHSDPIIQQGGFSAADKPDAFLVKFDSLGERIWGTYVGALGSQDAEALAVGEHNVYLGIKGTMSANTTIDTGGVYQSTIIHEGMLIKFDSSGSPYWGAHLGYKPYGLSVDNIGNIYCAGGLSTQAYSPGVIVAASLATAGTVQPNPFALDEGLLTKFNSNGERVWATWYGGEGNDAIRDLAVDQYGDVYVIGTTNSSYNITTSCSHQESIAWDSLATGTYFGISDFYDIFLAKIGSSGNRQWGSYYGGRFRETSSGIVCTQDGRIIIYGTTISDTGISTNGTFQDTFSLGTYPYSTNSPGYDLLIACFDGFGKRLWGTYAGSSDASYNAGGYRGISVDKYSNFYLSGAIAQDGLQNPHNPLLSPGSFLDTCYQGYNSFLTKFSPPPIDSQSYAVIHGPDSICPGQEYTYYIPDVEDALAYSWVLPNSWSGSSDSTSIIATSGSEAGEIFLKVLKCEDTVTIGFKVHLYSPDPAEITVSGFVLGTVQHYSEYQWCKDGIPIPGATDSTYTVPENGFYSVITVSDNGCIDTSELYEVTNVDIENLLHLQDDISIYPNPVQSLLYIQSPISVNVSIASIEGKNISRYENAEQIPVKKLANGVYMLRISDKSGKLIKVEKFVKSE